MGGLNMPSLKVPIRSPSYKTLLEKDVQDGAASCQVWVARPHHPWRDVPAVPSQGCSHLWLWGAELDLSEAQQDFAVQPEPLNCSRCFAAAQQFVIKTQLAILIRLSV